MVRKKAIHQMINHISAEILGFIKEHEIEFKDRWVPAVYIKSTLELNFLSVPKDNKQYGEKGWLFAIIARMLEDQNLVEYRKLDGNAYYRSL